VWKDPAPFQAFIDGGNVALHRATSAALAAAYAYGNAAAALDVGMATGGP
jgi:hypothetical protein